MKCSLNIQPNAIMAIDVLDRPYETHMNTIVSFLLGLATETVDLPPPPTFPHGGRQNGGRHVKS